MNPMDPDFPVTFAERATDAYATYKFNAALAYAATKGLIYPMKSSAIRRTLV